MLQRAERNGTVAFLPQSDRAGLDRLGAVPVSADYGHLGQMEQIRRLGFGIDEDPALPRLIGAARQQSRAEALEHRFAGMHPDGIVTVFRAMDRQAAVHRLWVDVHRASHGVGRAQAFGREVEDAARVALQSQVDQGAAALSTKRWT